jgi:hypothetical protein
MRLRCPACRKVLIATTAVVMCACGALAHLDNDDEPAPRTPTYELQMQDPSALGSGGAGIVSQVPPYIFAAPQSPEFPYAEIFHATPRMSAAQLDAWQKRRYPVVVEGTWRSDFERPDDPAPKSPQQMIVGRFTPAAAFYGPTSGLGISSSSAWGELTDATPPHRA